MRRALHIALLLGIAAAPAWALETDQFTVPSTPLHDLGAAMDARFIAELKSIVSDANAAHLKELRQADDPGLLKYWRQKHAERSEDVFSRRAIARAVYDRVSGGNMQETYIENWLRHRAWPAPLEATFSPSLSDSIYGNNVLRRPLLIAELSPTILLCDQYVGTDKTGHFVQQGYEYYAEFLKAREAGKSEKAATQAAIAIGVGQEHGIYGEALIGVYSNADLAANYSGFLFYRNLFEPVQVGQTTIEPMIVRVGNELRLTARVEAGPIRPFVTEHWNEAMNPCHYARLWRPYLRERIAQRTEAWMAFYHSSESAELARQTRVQTFFGQEYGHSGNDGLITLLNASPELLARK